MKLIKFMKSQIHRYLLSGLLIWLPIWVTYLAISFLVNTLDNTLTLIPQNYQPDYLLGFHIPGLGLIFTLLLLFFTGMIATNFLGRHIVRLWDRMISRIPLVRSIYTNVKKMVEMVLGSNARAFRKVVWVEFPREGAWSLAFQTGDPTTHTQLDAQSSLVPVFIPTTPNPTAGFLIMVPAHRVHEVDMTIDDALKMIISLGVVQPQSVINENR